MKTPITDASALARFTTTTTKPPTAYPFARVDGRTIPVSEARRGGSYTCLGCGAPMIPRLGSVNAHHFAHKAAGKCDPDNALHETAKVYVERLFLNAKRLGERLDIQHACPDCGTALHTDMAAGDRITIEETVVPNTRSDLAVFRNGVPHMIIEVVVTHNLDDNTRVAYEKSGILVVRVHPSWVAGGVACDVGDALNAPVCNRCTMRSKHVDDFMNDMLKHDGIPRLITHDKNGRPLYQNARSEANKQALFIVQCGFTQQTSRPTLFKYETQFWRVYVDIDSTDVMPMWETDAAAAVYTVPKTGMDEGNCIPDCRNCVVNKAMRVLEKSGVRTRRYFLDDTFCLHEGRPDIKQRL